MPVAINALIYIAFLAFAIKRLMTYLMALQQDDYDNTRVLKWMGMHNAFDKKVSAVLGLIALVATFNPFPDFSIIVDFLLVAAFISFALIEKDARKESKKKLVMTQRATRIFFAGIIPLALISLVSFIFANFTWQWILLVQLIPFCLLGGNLALAPYEKAVQKKFWNEAHNKVTTLSPTVIGITGSFGKTSVKHILGHILKMNAPTLITPGSVNTPMGITRIIREQLDESHKFFIVEMGAYGHGSIKRLCDLTPPDFGILTAIGHAHYERFKTLDAVAETKYELANAVLDKGGKNIVHERTLRFEYSNGVKTENESSFIVCGEPGMEFLKDGDAQIQKIDQTIKGLVVELNWKNQEHTIKAPLFGLHHGHNLALCFITALELGLEEDAIHTALKTVPQIQHRLEVKKLPDGRTIIDDAFNSNPIGFQSAIELLHMLGNAKEDNPARTILITPGMVEMGKAHEESHRSIGEVAGKLCDIAIVVKGERIPSFIDGFKAKGPNKQVVEVDSFTEASAWAEKNKAANDIILIENDLPDIYERVPRM